MARTAKKKVAKKTSLNRARDIPYNKLEMSEDNVRQIRDEVYIETLADDIGLRGVLTALNVRPIFDENGAETDRFCVPAGGSRFLAIGRLVERGVFPTDGPVPCVVSENTETSEREDSYAENFHRQQLHPLDEFRAMQGMVAEGSGIETIAARFKTTAAVVRQRLRLASVSPKLLEVYAGDGMTLDQLIAFSVNEDNARQEQVWEQLAHSYNKSPSYIREKLTEDTVHAGDKRARFVGVDAFKTAGGHVMRDLFDDDDGGWLDNPTLLDRLVSEKLKTEGERIAAEGWKWVAVAVDLPFQHARGMREIDGEEVKLTKKEQARVEKLQAELETLEAEYADQEEYSEEIEARMEAIEREISALVDRPLRYNAEEMANAGAFVSIDRNGALSVDRGYVRPEDEASSEEDGETQDDAQADEGEGSAPRRVVITLGGDAEGDADEHALAKGPHAMAMDAGSTDSGAAYLAKGVSKNDRGSVKKDLTLLMAAQQKAKIPILIGTAGQAGGDLNVNWTRDIVLEIAREQGYKPKIALLYSEQSPQLIKRKLAEGRISNLPPLGDLTEEVIDSCLHIVALMGPEPYHAALEAGADIIIGGRASDPAVIAAFALWKGAPVGPCWHAGKIAECGGQATSANTGQRGVFIEIHEDGFDVEPVDPKFKATVESISGHLLYENKSPWRLTEPGGELDTTRCEYIQLNDRAVRGTGSVWDPKPYTMKLEGASGNLFQTVMIVGITDPEVLASPQEFHDKMLAALTQRAKSATGLAESEFHISLRMYGYNGVSGMPPPKGAKPLEIGLMGVITAKTQAQASEIAKACNPYFFHMPLHMGMELPSYGWAFTPGDIDRGPVYQFVLNHVVSVDDPMELVRMELIDA